jgi:hypothetical protein
MNKNERRGQIVDVLSSYNWACLKIRAENRMGDFDENFVLFGFFLFFLGFLTSGIHHCEKYTNSA